jgi:hypothetical protein
VIGDVVSKRQLYDIKTAITAADLVNNRVLPFYDEPGIPAVLGTHQSRPAATTTAEADI